MDSNEYFDENSSAEKPNFQPRTKVRADEKTSQGSHITRITRDLNGNVKCRTGHQCSTIFNRKITPDLNLRHTTPKVILSRILFSTNLLNAPGRQHFIIVSDRYNEGRAKCRLPSRWLGRK